MIYQRIGRTPGRGKGYSSDMIDWQTIDTAPKQEDLAPIEKDRILLYVPRTDGGTGKCVIGYWYPFSEVFKQGERWSLNQGAHWYWEGCWANGFTYKDPTHWAPLNLPI